MYSILKYLVLTIIALPIVWSNAAQAQTRHDSYVVSTGLGSSLSEEGAWGRATYLHLWAGMVAGRRGEWRPYVSVSVPFHQLSSNNDYDQFGNRRGRYELKAINIGGTYSINSALTAYIGGGWTHQRARARVYQDGSVMEGFSRDTFNVAAGVLVHVAEHVGINFALGANPGTASLSANFRF